ncbi:hypothetical protein [Streptomyces albipurpureus]|uniref:C2H2-type domain-containing protein n=1 Tax=Streptomyces albipurpureus TaxID=2897419 RepID=A0ABT0UPE3_9ACTN|nr:hypothetical protein [Streptomyces sp. CWNU-1]MCM2390212.1 hypothetical protein [Streptomyces sp. CWNU-1]
MTSTQDGWLICYPCGVSQPAARLHCPRCTQLLTHARTGWHQCTDAGCAYEISDDALRLHQRQLADVEARPAAFFAGVRRQRDELRSCEPVWRRIA